MFYDLAIDIISSGVYLLDNGKDMYARQSKDIDKRIKWG